MIYSHYSEYMAKSMSAGRPGPDAGELEFMQRHLDACEQPFLELACGYGRLLLPLMERGYRVVGTDSSPAMLAECRRLARRKRLTPVLRRQFMQRLSLRERFGLIFIADGGMALVIEEPDRLELLRRVHAHLKPGGVFLFDIFTPWVRSKEPARKTGTGWVKAADGSIYVGRRDETFDPGTNVQYNLQIHDRYVSGKLAGSQAFVDPMRYDEPSRLSTLLANAGFVDIVVTDYHSDRPLKADSGMVSFVCRKPRAGESHRTPPA